MTNPRIRRGKSGEHDHVCIDTYLLGADFLQFASDWTFNRKIVPYTTNLTHSFHSEGWLRYLWCRHFTIPFDC